MARARITSRGQATIPKDVQERLGLRPGDEVEFVEDESGYRIQKRAPASPFKRHRGYLKGLAGHDPGDLVEQMRGG
jgi:AbrB family looped-hinge helix DNA binding protein